MTTAYQVAFTFRRIQTFLTQVPKLREMIGANVLLGEQIRRELTQLAKGRAECPEEIHKKVAPKGRGRRKRKFFSADGDPLKKISCEEIDKDDPYKLLSEYGVMLRDGGHFSAVFMDEDQAKNFIKKAINHISRLLDGLPYDIKLEKMTLDGTSCQLENVDLEAAPAASLVDLPFFQVCQASGQGPASEEEKRNNEILWIGEPTKNALEASDRFVIRKNTQDIIGLLQDKLPLNDKEAAADFKQLCNDGKQYLAVIHADGNGMGVRGHAYKETYNDNSYPAPILPEALIEERLFYSMRVAVRRAVIDALKNTFTQEKFKDYQYRPYQLLMLGGDDLLMVCQANFALEFVEEYAQELQKINLADDKPLSIGAGVVFAAHNVPFHHLHHLAEELASSAKHLFRQQKDQNPSVVDWMVVSNSWSDDPIAIRKQVALKRYQVDDQSETLILTGKPYRILASDTDQGPLNSLAKLREAAEKLKDSVKQEDQGAARSQLRQLVLDLHQGRLQGELAFDELPKSTRQELKNHMGKVWNKLPDNHWLTHLADLVELSEISRLGRSD